MAKQWQKQNDIIIRTLKKFGIDNVNLYYDTKYRFFKFGCLLLIVYKIDKNWFMDLCYDKGATSERLSHVIVSSTKFEIIDSLVKLFELAIKYLSKSSNSYKADAIITLLAYMEYYKKLEVQYD
jgi:hypothetical protein